MIQKEWKRMGIQVIASSLILAFYLFRFGNVWPLYFQLLSVCVLAILISTLIEHKVQLKGALNSVTLNLLAVFVFYGLGMVLSDQFSLEVIENVQPDLEQRGSNDEVSMVVTSAIINFGGLEFLFIYGFHAIFAYAKYLPDYHKTEEKAVEKAETRTSHLNRKFSVKQGGRLHFIDYEQIDYVEASGNYINIFSDGRKYTLRESLKDWLDGTGKDHLLRVHRSFVINANMIKELTTNSEGQYSVILDSGESVKVGKQYKSSLFEFLGLS